MNELDISLRRETRLVIGQRMYQSMSFLQMSVEELEEALNELSMENPVLENTLPADAYRVFGVSSGNYRSSAVGTNLELPIPDKSLHTLRDALMQQVNIEKQDKRLEEALRFLIINLDDRGYIPEHVTESRRWTAERELYERALALLQSMEPAGVGARDLSECLRIQLRRKGLEGSPADLICRDYLEHLARNHINHIARALSLPESEVAEAKAVITALEPIPSNGFDDAKDTVYVTPDVYIETDENGELKVKYAEHRFDRYCLNTDYCELAKDRELGEEERNYLREKINEAQWALNCVKHRSETLLRCAAFIAETQEDFFRNRGLLQPCSMADAAYSLGIHSSTVSRAVKNKYISCKWGVFPFSRFFAYDVGGDTASGIISAMNEIIAGEDPVHPLSDNAIAAALAEQGYEIARRTVAKYREKSGIPPATGRKER